MAFPDETATKDGVAITDSSLLLKQTYHDNFWLFEDSTDLGWWSINEDVSFPYLKNALYTSYVFPNDSDVTQNGTDITDANLKKEESYTNNNWDFETIWAIQEDKYFPRFCWEPAIAEGSRLIIGTDAIPLNIQSLQDNNNISFTENKVNSTSTKSYMVFNGNKRRKITISAYTTYENYELLAEAAENYYKCYTYIYPPLNITENITPYSYFYITALKTSYKLGDSNNIYYDIELTFGGYWGDFIPDDYVVFNTSDDEHFYTSDSKRFIVQY